MKKEQPGLWKHVLAGVVLIMLAATWNVQYHRAQAAKQEADPNRWRREWRDWRLATDEERKAAIASIKSQLEAFRQDNYQRAALFQSESLKGQFPSVGAFRRMIKTTYPQFAEHKAVEFGRARANEKGDHVAVRTILTGKDGVKVRALYMMIREGKVYRVKSVMGGMRHRYSPGDMPRRERPIPSISA